MKLSTLAKQSCLLLERCEREHRELCDDAYNEWCMLENWNNGKRTSSVGMAIRKSGA